MKKVLSFLLICKIILFSAILIVCVISPIYAMDFTVTLEWKANIEPDLAGYKIYYKSGSPDEPYNGTGATEGDSPVDLPIEGIDTNVPIYTLTNLSDTQIYYFAVAAYDIGGGESDYSNEVTNAHEDPDEDGLTNIQEFDYNTDLQNPDTDGDDLPDGWEIENGLNPLSDFGVDGRDGDFDQDGWSNYEEYINQTNPNNNNSPIITSPEVKETKPCQGAGISDDTRIPYNTSFGLLLEDLDGIDITDANSVRFTISDGVNQTYERDLSDTTVIRVVKLDLGESDTWVTKLWVVYDRSGEDELGPFTFDQNINIKVDAKDKRQDWMEQADYDFKIETEEEHAEAQANLPPTEDVAGDDPALTGPYNAGSKISGGDLYGAKIVYNSTEPVIPTFGPINELTALNIAHVEAIGMPINLRPPTVFTTPVKVFIPCPGQTEASELSIYFYNGISWVMACNANGHVQPGGEAWMVPDSRVDHNESEPPMIEIKVYYFYGQVQAGRELPRNILNNTSDDNADDSGKGGCFIDFLQISSRISLPLTASNFFIH